MSIPDLIATLDVGVREGRIAPYLADFIAAQALDVAADDVGYSEWGTSDQLMIHASHEQLTPETHPNHYR